MRRAERGVDIGGDWYDVIVLDDRRVLLVVGDVSGHGLRAAATMATLRYSIRAYAVEGDAPAEILAKLSRLVNITTTGQLATVLCVSVDVGARRAHRHERRSSAAAAGVWRRGQVPERRRGAPGRRGPSADVHVGDGHCARRRDARGVHRRAGRAAG